VIAALTHGVPADFSPYVVGMAYPRNLRDGFATLTDTPYPRRFGEFLYHNTFIGSTEILSLIRKSFPSQTSYLALPSLHDVQRGAELHRQRTERSTHA
jgi:hypothetical protein